MVEISDDAMEARLGLAHAYCMVLLKVGPNYQPSTARSAEQAKIVWEHGRRNMQLSAEGKMAIVGPVLGGLPIAGICIFTVTEAETKAIMDGDPAIRADIFVYEILTFFGFPGDALPPA